MGSEPQCAAALSTERNLDAAVGEVADELDGALGGPSADLSFIFATHHYAGDLPRLSAEIVEATGTQALVGCTGAFAVGAGREEEHSPGLAVLSAKLPGTRVDVRYIGAPGDGTDAEEAAVDGDLGVEDPARASALLFADPFSFPVPTWLQKIQDATPDLTVAGGLSSGGIAPGQNVLFAGDTPINSGAVAVTLEGDTRVVTAVSQGCRPIGPPLVVTRVDGNILLELRGQPAAKVMFEILEDLDEAERRLFQGGAFVGRAVNAAQSSFAPGDLLVRNLMGLDPQRHAIAVADNGIRVGSTVQFMVRDGASASAELDAVLEVAGLATAGQAAGGLLFTCSGRGHGLFGRPHHDAAALERSFGPGFPVAGFSAGGEIGPVGGTPFLHAFTASIALFAPRD